MIESSSSLRTQHFPGNVRPKLFAQNNIAFRARGVLDRWAVLRGELPVHGEPGGDVAPVLVPKHFGECGLPTEDSGGPQESVLGGFSLHEDASLMCLDPRVKAYCTEDETAGYVSAVDPQRKEFGRRLKTAREARGLTQLAVAEHFDVAKGTVSAWETGGGVPDALRLQRLARLYEVTVESLLGDMPLTIESVQIARQFDRMGPVQQRTARALWSAIVDESRRQAEEAERAAPALTQNKVTPLPQARESERKVGPHEWKYGKARKRATSRKPGGA
jgi:transcriptional regulator with XRE-family HTH domain